MKVCSFLPAATAMIYDMHLDPMLCGVTFECISDKPKVVRSRLEGNELSSSEIDQIVSSSKAKGQSLYYIEEDLLQELSPDIIFTQNVCDVCQISDREVQQAIYRLPKQPKLIPLHPHNIQEVFQNAIEIAESCGEEEAAYIYLSALKKRMDHITDQLRKHRIPQKRVSLLEWLDPIYNCGHWIPDQLGQAGGIDLLSHPGGLSIVTSWQKILQYNPEILVLAPCGFKAERAFLDLPILAKKDGWNELRAYGEGKIYFADADHFTQPGARNLVEGIELLAFLFHPELFALNPNLKGSYLSLKEYKPNFS